MVDPQKRVITKTLPCTLTKDELIEKGEALAQSCADIRDEEGKQALEKKRMKDALTAMEDERSRIAAIVHSGKEDRSVKVELTYRLTAGMVEEVRMDTGETLAIRPMTDSERQMVLPGVDVTH